MAAGKTETGKILAEKLALPFIDLDTVIESAAGKSINTIFEDSGEKAFRDMEEQQLARIIQSETKYIMACGGGVILRPKNMQNIHKAGVSVFIDSSEERIIERLRNTIGDRPLLKHAHAKNMRQIVHPMLKSRRPLYLQANIVYNPETQAIQWLIENLRK